jgi:hypothetical protein
MFRYDQSFIYICNWFHVSLGFLVLPEEIQNHRRRVNTDRAVAVGLAIRVWRGRGPVMVHAADQIARDHIGAVHLVQRLLRVVVALQCANLRLVV